MFSILEPAANGRLVRWPVGPLHLSCPALQRSLAVHGSVHRPLFTTCSRNYRDAGRNEKPQRLAGVLGTTKLSLYALAWLGRTLDRR